MKALVEYEETALRLDRLQSRSAVRLLLTQHAEYGGWELARLRKYPDGRRVAWLRRKIIKMARTW